MVDNSSPALILRHLDYGEADRIVTLFTPVQGRIKAFAAHARKSRKRFGAALDLFASSEITWSPRSRGDLLKLTGTELVCLRPHIRESLPAFALANYACELVELLLEEGQPLPELYALLQALLDALDAGEDPGTGRLLYELRLVQLLGYTPHLRHCSLCQTALGEGRFLFHLLSGGAVCGRCRGRLSGLDVGAGTLGSLSRCLRIPLEQFTDVRLGRTTLNEGGMILQQILSAHWSRPPKSLDFLVQVSAPSNLDNP